MLKPKYFSFHLAVFFAQSIEASCKVENEDIVGAAPAGDAPTTSEWSTVLMLTKVSYIRGFTLQSDSNTITSESDSDAVIMKGI